MLKLTIENEDGTRCLTIGAENMRELIDVKLPAWTPKLAEDLPLFQQTKRFKADPEGEEAKERASGWYYDC